MANIAFWILIAVIVIIALVTIRVKGFTFIDTQVLIASAAVALFFDMVFCKWLQFYSYVVTTPLKAFYSLAFCVIGYPAIGLAFIKFLPSTRKGILLSIALWSAALTLSEIYIAHPLGIVIYDKWIILLYSPIIYIISLYWEYGYYKLLERRWKGR